MESLTVKELKQLFYHIRDEHSIINRKDADYFETLRGDFDGYMPHKPLNINYEISVNFQVKNGKLVFVDIQRMIIQKNYKNLVCSDIDKLQNLIFNCLFPINLTGTAIFYNTIFNLPNTKQVEKMIIRSLSESYFSN